MKSRRLFINHVSVETGMRHSIPISFSYRLWLTQFIFIVPLTVGIASAFAESSAEDWRKPGHLEFLRRDYDAARASYNRAIELDPKYARAYFERGDLKREIGDIDGAIADYMLVVELDPKYAIAYYRLGHEKSNKGDLDGAIAEYTRFLEHRPENAGALLFRGNAKREKGNFEDAILDYTHAIRLAPKLPDAVTADAYISRAELHYALQRFTDALVDLQHVLEIRPLNENRRLLMFLARSRLGQRAAAISELRQYVASRRPPDEGEDWAGELLAYMLGQRSEQALLDSAQASGRNCEAHFYIGSLKLLAGDKIAATTHFRAATCTLFPVYPIAKAELDLLTKSKDQIKNSERSGTSVTK